MDFAYCVVRHEVAEKSCSQLVKVREPSVPPGDARSLNQERLRQSNEARVTLRGLNREKMSLLETTSG